MTAKVNKQMKARIQKLIDVYCTFMFGVDRDAGWHAPSQLEALQSASMAKKSGSRAKFLTVRFSASVEHQVNDKPDEKMINEMRFVRRQHYEFGLAKMLLSRLEDKQLLALLAGCYLSYVYKRKFSQQEIADYLEMEVRAFRHNKKRAEILVEQHLDFIDQHEQLKSA